jgi:CBS domain-containing protein
MPVKKIMTRRVITATEDMEIEEAAALMLKEGIARLPVCGGKNLSALLPVRISSCNRINGDGERRKLRHK